MNLVQLNDGCEHVSNIQDLFLNILNESGVVLLEWSCHESPF